MIIKFYRLQKIDEPNYFYIGSCINLSRRKAQHKKAVSNKRGKGYHRPLYMFIRITGGWINFEMILLEEYECPTHKDRQLKEQEFIDMLKPPLNSINAILKKTI
jgi:hypothetical protein